MQEWYEEFREYNGRRPTALEAYQSSFNPRALRAEHGSWFGFVRKMSDLTEAEARALSLDAGLLTLVERTDLTKSYKLLVLQAMLLRGTLPGVITLPDLAGAFASLAAKSSRLRADVSVDLDDEDALERLLKQYPCERLAADKQGGAPMFELKGGTFGTTQHVQSSADSALPDLVEEIVEWRLAEYLDRPGDAVIFRVIQNASRNPIVKIDRKRHQLPEGWAPVVMGGRPYQVNFAKEYVNVARELGSEQNVLPAVLRDWFGPGAGEPGLKFEVSQTRAADGSIRWEPVRKGTNEVAPDDGRGAQVVDDQGQALDARFAVEYRGDTLTIVFMSRGDGRNNQYNEGLEVLLTRLGRLGASLAEVQVESGATRKIAAEGWRLELPDYAYPIALGAGVDVAVLRLAMGRAAAALGCATGAKGAGNATKRLRLTVSVLDGVVLSEGALRNRIAGGPLARRTPRGCNRCFLNGKQGYIATRLPRLRCSS